MWRNLRINRNFIAAAHDAFMAAASFLLALYLRLGDAMVSYAGPILVPATLFFAVVALTVFVSMRQYRGLWRYASMQDLLVITRAVTICIIFFYGLLFLFTRLEGIPRSLPMIHWLLLLAMLGGPRFLYRVAKDRQLGLDFTLAHQHQIPVLLVGASDNAALFIRDSMTPASQYYVVGIVEDNKTRHDRTMHGVKIYGDVASIPTVVRKLDRKGRKPQRIILADDHLDGQTVRHILSVADELGLTLARLPKLTELKSGVKDKADIRPVALEDLLGRSQAVHDREALRNFVAGKVVMITGAGGTIGGELTRQIAGYKPAKLILFEQSEYHLYTIDRELGEDHKTLPREAVLGDVRSKAHLDKVIAAHKPDILFHAAAIKHVPLAEANPEEAVLTNVLGTEQVANACTRHGVGVMVLISTDKAVNPTNVMGATKRLAESYCQAKGSTPKTVTRFIAVRFGNVLGSTGSVVPLFQHQLERGGPITITHPDVTRYFMTVREAVELVIQAALMGSSDTYPNGAVFVLDMGQAVRIEDLAVQMIKLAGLRPHIDIKIEYTGLRAGEKLYEELFHFSEQAGKTAHQGIMLASPRMVELSPLAEGLSSLYDCCEKRRGTEAVTLLRRLVPEFHSDT